MPQTSLWELADARTLFSAVAAVADALYVVDPEGRISFLNPAALTILGYQDERQLLGRPSHDTMHYLRPDGTPFPDEECPLLRPRVTGETIRVDEDWFVRQDESLVAVAYSSAPISLQHGWGAVVSFRDISERRRLDQALRERDLERVRAAEIEASRTRIAEAADEARRRIERDLHDGAQQRFLIVAMRLEAVRGLVTAPTEAGAAIEAALTELRQAMEELRQLAHGIHPPLLARRGGLRAVLRGLARRSNVAVDVQLDADLHLSPPVQAAAYFIAAEALANVSKHARAKQVTIRAELDGNWVRLDVTDDGIGGATLGKGFGLQGMVDRAEAAGGHLELKSPSGGPTAVAVRLPVATPHADSDRSAVSLTPLPG